MKKYQQGDVLIISVESIPSCSKESGCVLAEGEATGHSHRLNGKKGKLLRDGNRLYLKAVGNVIITHEEHGDINVPAGSYEVKKVREYDHFAEEAKEVLD